MCVCVYEFVFTRCALQKRTRIARTCDTARISRRSRASKVRFVAGRCSRRCTLNGRRLHGSLFKLMPGRHSVACVCQCAHTHRTQRNNILHFNTFTGAREHAHNMHIYAAAFITQLRLCACALLLNLCGDGVVSVRVVSKLLPIAPARLRRRGLDTLLNGRSVNLL